MPLAIFWNVCQTSFCDQPRCFVCQIIASQGEVPAFDMAQPGKCFGKFGLAIALYTCNSQYFTCVHTE